MPTIIAIKITNKQVIIATNDENNNIVLEKRIINNTSDWQNLFKNTTPETKIFDERNTKEWNDIVNPPVPASTAQQIQRFKLKPNITDDDLTKLGFKISPSNEYYYYCRYFTNKKLNFEISITIKIPKDMEPWDDVTNVDVLDEDFLQPYTPFYAELKRQSKNEYQPSFHALNWAIDTYNKYMSSLDILEKANITK